VGGYNRGKGTLVVSQDRFDKSGPKSPKEHLRRESHWNGVGLKKGQPSILGKGGEGSSHGNYR